MHSYLVEDKGNDSENKPSSDKALTRRKFPFPVLITTSYTMNILCMLMYIYYTLVCDAVVAHSDYVHVYFVYFRSVFTHLPFAHSLCLLTPTHPLKRRSLQQQLENTWLYGEAVYWKVKGMWQCDGRLCRTVLPVLCEINKFYSVRVYLLPPLSSVRLLLLLL